MRLLNPATRAPDDGTGAAAPAGAVDSAPASAPSSGADDFSNLGSAEDLDFVEVSDESVVASAEVPAAVVDKVAETPLPVPASTPSAPPPPAAAQPVQEQAPAQAAPAPVPAESAIPDSPQGFVEQLAQHRSAVISALAADRFKLTPEEATALDTDAMAAIPQVMARVYYEATTTALIQMQNLVPKLVQQVLAAEKTSTEAESSFYGRFKSLDRAKHHADVVQFANGFRQMNPKMSQDDLFAMVGAAVMAKHGVSSAPVPGPNGAAPVAQPMPFVPAAAGAKVSMAAIPDPWAGLGQSFDDE
jgi:hypothetical protein